MSLKPHTITIPIYQGDDRERLAELRMSAAIAERQAEVRQAQHASQAMTARRVGDAVGVSAEEVEQAEAEAQAARDAYDAFLDTAAERAMAVQVRHIGRRRFRDLVAAHPVRTEKNDKGEDVTNPEDAQFGVNVETFPHALLTFAEAGDDGVRTIVSGPDLSSQRTLEAFLDDDVSDGDYDKLWVTAYWANRSTSSDPKELRYSPSTSATSE